MTYIMEKQQGYEKEARQEKIDKKGTESQPGIGGKKCPDGTKDKGNATEM